MPPKKVPFKAPAASMSSSHTIAPSSASQPPPLSQLAPAGKTKLALASIPDVAALQAKLEDLREEKDMLTSIYRQSISRSSSLMSAPKLPLQQWLPLLLSQHPRLTFRPRTLPRAPSKWILSCLLRLLCRILQLRSHLHRPPRPWLSCHPISLIRFRLPPSHSLLHPSVHLSTTLPVPSKADELLSPTKSIYNCAPMQPSTQAFYSILT